MKDHREIGRDQGLFLFHECSPGNPIWLPHGVTLYRILAEKLRNLVLSNGYHEVMTPAIYKPELYERSGHAEHFAANMFEVLGSQDDEYVLKPMNCPSHMLVFKASLLSYRDLPYRLYDQSLLHRDEPSGAIGGLTRCRSFRQDDAHIFLSPEMLDNEIDRLIGMVQQVYKAFHMPVRAVLSTRPEKSMGKVGQWDVAEKVLHKALGRAFPNSYKVEKGEGAFYGPKIDFTVQDSQKREWQTATIQLDFQLPERFGLEYVEKDNSRQRPVVIHRAIYGSFERFIGILLEHYQGNLPFWLAPVQCCILPIADRHLTDCLRLAKAMTPLRVIVDDDNQTLAHKIAAQQPRQIPYLIVVGDKEVQTHAVSVRQGDKNSTWDTGAFIEKLLKEDKFSF